MFKEKSFQLDIFKLLGNLGKSGDAYAQLSAEERKGFAPLVVQRWLTGTKDEGQILALNTFANKYVFALSKHPHLLAQLFQACATGRTQRYQWLGIKGNQKTARQDEALKQTFGWSGNELKRQRASLTHLGPTDFLMAAEALGWQKDEVANLKKELENG